MDGVGGDVKVYTLRARYTKYTCDHCAIAYAVTELELHSVYEPKGDSRLHADGVMFRAP